MSLIRRESDMPPVLSAPTYPSNAVWEAGTARHVLAVLYKWKWLILGALLAIFLPIAIFSTEEPTVYQAAAKVMIKQERAYLAVTASDLDRLVASRDMRQLINSEMQIITSREVIVQAVEALQLNRSMVGTVRGGLAVVPIRDSNLIQIAFADNDPEIPVKVVNKIVEVYQERHAAIHNPKGVLSFFEKQVDAYGQKLREAEAQLNELEAQARIPGTDMGITEALDNVGRLEKERQAVETEMGELHKQIALFKAEIAKQPATTVETQETAVNPEFGELSRAIPQLETEKQKLLQRYKEQHPAVLAKQHEIEAARARLATVQMHIPSRTYTRANPMLHALENDLHKARGRLESLQEKQRVLDKQLAFIREYLPELNRQRFEYQRLQQEVEISRHNYNLYQRKREEARISEAMDQDKLVNVGVVEWAASPASPIGQESKKVTLVLAAFTGIAVGIGAAFGIEFFNPAFKDERELEKHLELPVLATIEHFRV